MALKEGSRFFRPSVAQYTSQFVEEPYPIDELIQEGRLDQQKRDMTMGALGQMSEYLQVNADPSQEKFKTDLLKNYYGRVDKLASQLSEGASPDQVLGALTKINRDWQTDERRRELETGAIQGQAWEQTKRELMSQNKFAPWLTDMERVREANKQGEFTPIRFEGMESYLDPTNAMGKIYGQITASSNLGTKVNIDEGTGKVTSIRSGAEKITEDDVTEVAKASADFFLRNSDEGRQYILKLKALNPNITEEQIFQEATRDMYNLNLEQIFKKTQYHEDISFPSALTPPETGEPAGPNYGRRQEQHDFQTIKPRDLTKKEFSKSEKLGMFDPSTTMIGLLGYGVSADPEYNVKERKYKDLTDEQKVIVKKAIRHESWKKLSDQELENIVDTEEGRELAKKYIEKNKTIQYSTAVSYAPYEDNSGAKTDYYSKMENRLKKRSRGLRWYDIKENEVLEAGTKRKNKDKKSFEDLMFLVESGDFDIVGDYDPKNFVVAKTGDNDFANSVLVKVFDKDKKEQHELLVTKDDSEQKSPMGIINKNINDAFNKTTEYPGLPIDHTFVIGGKEYPYEITYNKESGTWNFIDKEDPQIKGEVDDLKMIYPTARYINNKIYGE